MSERKVLNKYYPPDFDPSKIPRVKCPKNRQFTVRLMAPFNMRCKTCGEYIYKGKKFNARKEDVEGEDYLGIRIFRFYIKCTRCLQEISFRTDPKNTDYEIEAGATRNFMALKLAEEQAIREEEERKEEEASNPMKLLENRTKQSKHELDILESLEELKDMNKRQQSVDFDHLLSSFSTREAKERFMKMQEEEDEKFIKSVFGEKRIAEEEIVDYKELKKKKVKKCDVGNAPTVDVKEKVNKLPKMEPPQCSTKLTSSSSFSVGSLSNVSRKPLMSSLVKIKKSPSSLDEKLFIKTIDEKKPINGLSMLGSYSDSSDDST